MSPLASYNKLKAMLCYASQLVSLLRYPRTMGAEYFINAWGSQARGIQAGFQVPRRSALKMWR